MDIRPQDRKIIDLKHPHTEEAEKRAAAAFSRGPEVYVEWEALEYEHIPKEKNWFIAGGIVAGALVIFALITQNWFFAVFMVLASFVVFIYAVRPPKHISAAVLSGGVRFNHRLFDFDDLRSFWIFYEPGGMKELSLESRKTIMPHIRIPLGDTDPVEVRSILTRFIPEEKQEEAFADIISRIVGF